MRLLIPLSTLVGTSFASFDYMMEVMRNQWNSTQDRVMSTAAENFAIQTQINGYACWCMFDGEARGKAKGTPIDNFDSVCRRLNWAYQCIIFDAANNGDPDCIPWDVTYTNPGGNPQVFDADIASQCESVNTVNSVPPSSCVLNTCIAEAQFIRDINYITFILNEFINNDLRHSDENFVHLDSCPGFNHFSVLNLDCCGSYDNSVGRKPYNKGQNDERACCQGTDTAVTYLSALFVCCPDKTVQLSC